MTDEKPVVKKVKCKYCKLCDLDKSYCTVKKVTVSLNKKRRCPQHEFDVSLVTPKQELPTRRVQSWNLKNGVKAKDIEKLQRLKEELIRKEQMAGSKHPLTGDLSRFKTTGASDEQE